MGLDNLLIETLLVEAVILITLPAIVGWMIKQRRNAKQIVADNVEAIKELTNELVLIRKELNNKVAETDSKIKNRLDKFEWRMNLYKRCLISVTAIADKTTKHEHPDSQMHLSDVVRMLDNGEKAH